MDPCPLPEPLAYHRQVRDYLRLHEPEVWAWFSSPKSQEEYAGSIRLELLKSSYRLDLATYGELHAAAVEVKARLELDVPLTLYQAQSGGEMNARIYYLPGEAHVVLQGQLHGLLTARELTALLGHELAHYRLWTCSDGDYLTAFRVLHAMALDPRAENSHLLTARRFEQYVEIYADRGALAATSDLHLVIASLVKVQTGLKEVSAAAYLAQAEEIFAKHDVQSAPLTHPESFIRARALALWKAAPDQADAAIAGMIEGKLALRTLDLMGQVATERAARSVIEGLLERPWFRTESVVALSKLYFGDLEPGAAPEVPLSEIARAAAAADDAYREWLAYVLLDFALADRELGEPAQALALVTAAEIGVSAPLEERMKKELKLTKKELEVLKKAAPELARAAGAVSA